MYPVNMTKLPKSLLAAQRLVGLTLLANQTALVASVVCCGLIADLC